MKKRFIALGCSYTQCWCPTWSDYIGVNHEEYINLGRAGSSNTYAMNRLVEFNETYKLNSETDYVMVMLTGFGRFSWIADNNSKKGWQTIGDMYANYGSTKEKQLGIFLDNMWNERWAVYQSWIAVNNIKNLLTRNNITHRILMGINNSYYLNEISEGWGRSTILNKDTIKQVEEIYNIVSYKESLDEWQDKKYKREDHVFWEDTNCYDGHPTATMHFEYVKEKFPEYITEKSQAVFDYAESINDYSSQRVYGERYHAYKQAFDKNGSYALFE